MPDLLTIQKDPNYINANAATKAAIFEKWAPKDPNYAKANDATKAAIRQKFGIDSPKPEPSLARTTVAEAAAMGDVLVGNIPSAIVNQIAYSMARGRGGRSAQKAQQFAEQASAPIANPFAQRAGLANSGEYKNAMANRAAGYIGEKVGAGVDWLAGKIGMEPSDVGNIAGAASMVLPEAGSVVARRARPVINAVSEKLPGRNAMRDIAVKGGGAMDTPASAKRLVTAQGLRRPVQLTKGQITRDPAQLRFENETRKSHADTVGKPLVERQLQNNEDILANFDAYIDATGAEAAGEGQLRPVGKIVDKALVQQAEAAKKDINSAYDEARAAGELDEPISYQPLIEYANSKSPTLREKLAPIIDLVAEELRRNDPQGTGKISINAMEEIRQLVNRATAPGTPNAAFAPEIKTLIDGTMEGAAGELYQIARAKRMRYAKQFEDAGAVAKLLDRKGSTKDRAVGFEDVFKHSILSGTLDDTMNIGRLLKKTPEGQQAWKELQAQTVQHFKDAVTKSVATDSGGKPFPSPAAFQKLVREFDSDGKLDYIFGKQGAQEIRDLNQVVQDAYTAPPGTINFSNTAGIVVKALEKLEGSLLSKIPGVGPAARYAAERSRNKQLTRQVEDALYPNADIPDATGTPPKVRPPKVRKNAMAPANQNTIKNTMKR